MRDWLDRVNTIKSKSEVEIEKLVYDLSLEFGLVDGMLTKFKEILSSINDNDNVYIYDEHLFNIFLLGFILSDIKDQMDPFYRKENMQKIKNICTKNRLDYELVCGISKISLEIEKKVESII